MKTYSDLKRMSDERIAQEEITTRQAHEAIRELMTRNGFDHWWENLDADIQDDIFECIRFRIWETGQ